MREKKTTLPKELPPMDAFTLEWHRHNAPECEGDDDGKRLAMDIRKNFPNGTPEEKLIAIHEKVRHFYGA